ncbi:MAG: hypothetical protein M0Z73_07560 [Betaproteobacteria bacterium]|nr:hypothetical protein [Betaproteobacteria bacterium]
MAAADRQVRRLRLQAPSADAVRALLPRLEDGLRCASLPGQDSRVYLVRRLDLGRVGRDVTPQSLSVLIEQRMAAQGGAWVDGGTASADRADRVAFASRLDARIRLAWRLLRAAPVDAWYWPLAVPEFDPALAAAASLVRIATAVAQWPEARAALPAWLAAVESEAAGAVWLAGVDPALGQAWLSRAGIALPEAPMPEAPAPGGDGASGIGPDAGRASPARWWQPARQRTGRIAAPPGVRTMTLPEATGNAARAVPASHPVDPPGPVQRAGTPPARRHPLPPAPASMRRADAATRTLAPDAAHDEEHAASPVPRAERRPVAAATASADPPPTAAAALVLAEPTLRPTDAGGLLFLLPVLARLGLPQRLAGDEDAAGTLARAVLGLALRRLAVAGGDPAWALAETPGRAPDVAAQAALWLAAARRWLRRAGRIALASAVLRPARLSATPTHVDVHFRLQDTDLRVRRLGLDIDPGWLPWFGRVVSFHYLDAQP